MSAISSSPICGWSADSSACQLSSSSRFFCVQLALLVAQRRGFLEFLGLDRLFLLAADLRDLLLELAVSAAARSCS